MVVLASTRAKKRSYHQTFALRDAFKGEIARHTLLVNPEDMSFSEASKSSATETLGGGYITDFGSAFKEVTIQGITGYKARSNVEGVLRDGYTEFLHLRNNIYRRYIESVDPEIHMYWYNWEDDDYWRIHPVAFRLLRNKNEPVLYRYEFSFKLLRQLDSGYKLPPPEPIPAYNLQQIADTLSTSISNLSEAVSQFVN